MKQTGTCRLTGGPLTEILDLGDIYVSDFVPPGQEKNVDRAPLRLGMGPTGLIQLYDSYSPEKMYRKYWYRSSLNESMRKSLYDLVTDCVEFPGLKLQRGDVVVDIASNDGIMLTHPAYQDCLRIGIDPSDVAREGAYYCKPPQRHAHSLLVNDYFSESAYRSIAGTAQAKIITIVAMFYDIDKPVEFLREVKACLADDGLLCIQLSYTPLMYEQLAFDNICHEHCCFYTLDTLTQVVEKAGLKVVDVEINSVNAGSLRVYITHASNERSLVPGHIKSVEQYRVKALMGTESAVKSSYYISKRAPDGKGVTRTEAHYDINSSQTWLKWGEKIKEQGEALRTFLTQCKERGELVLGYAASTKANTLLQAWNITPDLLPAIADRSQPKWGTVCSGTGIPVISEDEMRERKPEYLLSLAYTFTSTFLDREKNLVNSGTKFVVPIPTLQILGNNS